MNPVYKNIASLDWTALVLVLGLVILTLGKYWFQGRFFNFLALPFNDKYIVLYSKKGRLASWFHIMMTLFQLINFSLFIFLVQRVFLAAPENGSLAVFFIIVGSVLGFQILKATLQHIKGFVFNTQELILEAIYCKVTYLNYSSLIMFLVNVILVHVLKDSKTVIYTALALILSINAIGLIKLLKTYEKVVVAHLFYFILYLCTLEIAPLVVIGSYLTD